jgi:hypothetical protein
MGVIGLFSVPELPGFLPYTLDPSATIKRIFESKLQYEKIAVQ